MASTAVKAGHALAANCLLPAAYFITVLSALAPSCQLRLHPARALILMAEDARVGAFILAEAPGHIGVGDLADLMAASFKQKCVHDSRHMARCAPAAFGRNGMVGVPRQ